MAETGDIRLGCRHAVDMGLRLSEEKTTVVHIDLTLAIALVSALRMMRAAPEFTSTSWPIRATAAL